MTKREMFAHISALCANDAEVVAFCEHETELLARKSNASSKPTKTQIENAGFKSNILDYLATVDRPVTISEIMDGCSSLAGLKNQRVNALVTQLKTAGLVVRTEVKGRAYFAIAG